MKKFKLIFLLLLIVSTAQTPVFMTEKGELEILGLKKWQGQTLIDSMKALAGNKPLHACAGQMIHDFGFAEVSVASYPPDFSGKFYTVSCIIEDNDDGKLHYLQEPEDYMPAVREYKDIAKSIKNNFRIYFFGLQTYKFVKEGKIEKAESAIASYKNMKEDIKNFWEFLKTKNKVSDMNLAFWILNNDANAADRCLALAVLTNFKEYDAVWWEVLNMQRTKNDTVKFLAGNVLQEFTSADRKIDWEPAILPVKYLLNGTNLFMFNTIIKILINTEISPELAERVLSGSTRILNLYLDARHKQTKEIAVNFIRQISGNDNLQTAEQCKKWLKKFN